MSPRAEFTQLINPRAGYLARNRASPVRPAWIVFRLALVLVLLCLFASLLSHWFAAL